MKNQDFIIGIKIVWALIIGSVLLTMLGISLEKDNSEFWQFIFAAGVTLALTVWIIIFSDIIKNKVYNKTFWIISMIILPSISPIIYLIRRNRLRC